ncbi:MAG TPA: DUF4013 domain-containing protein [Candidatus Dormibacteraeota bacterium]
MNELSDSIAWPSRDPEWVSKVLLNGLILFIPIVGQLVVLGWMLAALDNLRAGQPVLPPAGFSHIGRGVNLFVVILVYGVVLAVVVTVLVGAGFAIALSASGSFSALGVVLTLLGYGIVLLAYLALALASPAIIVATERGGIAGGLNVVGVIRLLSADVEMSLRVGLFALVSYVIGGAGAIACGVGQLFTTPYGYAVLAGVVHYYERNAGARATATR